MKSDLTRQLTAAATALAAVVWLALVLAAMIWMTDYSNSPGNSVTPPAQWPSASQIPRNALGPTLVLFAHPRCPCTRATLGELDLLMARSQGQIQAHVLFVQPPGTTDNWAQTDLWRKASVIPGVKVHRDREGVEAKQFHLETSGHALLYDSAGRLLFQGGITIARGHSGDNPGRSALTDLLNGGLAAQNIKTPVFGCALLETEAQIGDVQCKK
ncbi:MAG: RedB protein [Verrucomicrobia bacterium]|nr:RedB protein [Verrucomicrobiota bacterium]MBI3868453.1 RedB protein [Verrucomicrobiota bacterium]